MLVKGDRALILNWGAGPRVVGSYAKAAAGLGALPADYQKPRLPAAGRFIGTTDSGGSKIDLRVDLVGELPVVSGDVFNVENGVEDYSNSFVLDGTEPLTLPGTLEGTATYAWESSRPVVSVTVDKLAPGGIATVTRSNPDNEDDKPLTYTCAYTSRFLRTIDWEVDALAGTEPPAQYATITDPRPPDLAKKIITVQSAYAEAGIELRTTGTVVNEVAVEEAGQDLLWSDAELNAAMLANLSGHRDTAQWRLWSLIATRYAPAEAGVRGTMFDREGSHRQGMAVFHDQLAEEGMAGTRREIRTWVHEIGHALNLMHTFEKDLGNPPQPLGPREGCGDLSWMNYDWKYQGPDGESGADAYWAAFCYQFTESELRHLRHGFFSNVAMGGRDFGSGAADRAADRPALQQFDLPPAGRSGLRLELSGRDSFSHGEPVVTEIKLSLDGSTPQAEAFPNLSPRRDNLTILVTDPTGDVRPFRPIARACGGPDLRITLDASTPALYDSAYLGYGATGLTFPTPGTYRLRALYKAPDGSTVTSPERAIEVSAPRNEEDRQAGDLLIGSQQGTLLALLGSDAPQLQEGNDALDELIASHPDHPLAVYARMVKGTNAGRHFLTLTRNGVEVRAADTDTSIEQLGTVVQTTLDPGTDAGVDNITLNETMRRLARAHARAGDLKQADVVLDQLVDTFRDKHVPEPVLATIVEQAETARAQLHATTAPPA